SMHTGDASWFLERLAGADNKDEALRGDWRDLMHLAHGPDGFEPGARGQGERVMRGDKQLEEFLHKLEHPKKPAWKRKHGSEAVEHESRRRAAIEAQRRHYTANRIKVREGALGAILDPAKAYLGCFYEFSRDQPAPRRIAEWLGPELRDDAI